MGTPTSGVLTNCTGTASGLTAGNVSNVGTTSLAASGYQTLSGGIYIQWGTIAGATTSVTFPVAFPTACGACCVMYVGATSTASGIAATVTRTGFSIVATVLSRNWIAVGY